MPPGACTTTPLIIAHRAITPGALENARSSLVALAGSGADLVELDIRLSLDRQPFVLHDAFISRTTHGRGWVRFWPSFMLNHVPLRGPGNDHVASLREMLHAMPPGLQPALHIKDRPALRSVLRVIARHGDPASAWLWLDHAADVATARRILPDVRCTLLRPDGWKASTRARYLADARTSGATAISLPWGVIDESLLSLAHGHNLLAFTRQAEESGIPALLRLGIDGIVTDDPEATVRACARALSSA